MGSAKLVIENKLATTIIGTPHYMSPETIQSNGSSFSADFWSLGKKKKEKN